MSDTNSPVEVNVRIEGRQATIFESAVTTQGHDVTTLAGGTHRADGTNGNEYPFKVPTCTSALDDASTLEPTFGWDGKYYNEFEDFLVTKISSDVAGKGESWQLALNFRRAELGGGQTKIKKADSVVWALVKTQPPAYWVPLLKLRGPRSAVVDNENVVTVIDGETRKPVQGATVKEIQEGGTGTWTTDGHGQAKITFATAGLKKLKAEDEGKYVRSNALIVTAWDLGRKAL